MKKFRIMAMLLSLLLMLGSIGVSNVLAIEERYSEAALFETNFNDETGAAGTAPTTVKNPDTGATFAGTSRAVLCAADTNSRDSKHVDLITRVGAFLPDTITSGQFYIDFDAMVNKGFLSVGLIDTSSATGKWVFGLSRETSDQVYTWTNEGAVPPTSPSHRFVRKGTENYLTFSQNLWHSYCLKVDLDNASVTLFVDGAESQTVTGYTYFGGSNPGIKGVSFRNDFKTSESSEVYLDNIRLRRGVFYETVFADDFENGTSKWCAVGTATAIANDTAAIAGTVTKGAAITTYGATTATPSDPDNMVLALNSSQGTGAPVYAAFSKAVSGEFHIEAEFQGGTSGFGIGLVEEGQTVCGNYIFYVPSTFAFSYSNNGSLPNAAANTTKYLKQGTTLGLSIDKSQWHTLTLMIDPAAGTVKPYINGTEMEKTIISYLQGKTIRGVALADNRALTSGGIELDHIKYFDNIRVYAQSDGKSVSDIKTGSNKLRLTFKDAVDADTLTSEAVEITDSSGTAKDISDIEAISDTQALIMLADDLEDGEAYEISLSDDIAYADDNAILPYTGAFTYTKGSFTAAALIDSVIPTQTGFDAVATCTVNAGDLSVRSVQLILAAFDGLRLVGIKTQGYSYDESDYGQDSLSINEFFGADADTIKVFVWDGNQVPFCTNGIWPASN